MKIFKIALVLLIVFSSSLSMPVGSYTAGQDDASIYYPLEVGNFWTYQFGGNNGIGKYEVTGYLDDQRAYLVQYSAKMIDVSIATESIIGQKDGSVLNIGGTDIDSGQSRRIYRNSEVILKSPIKPGMTWSYEKDDKDNKKGRVRCEVVKIIDCDVKAGNFKDVCMIRRETYYTDRDTKREYREVHNEYYAPHVGKIKEDLVEDAFEAMREGHAVEKDSPEVLMELVGYKIK